MGVSKKMAYKISCVVAMVGFCLIFMFVHVDDLTGALAYGTLAIIVFGAGTWGMSHHDPHKGMVWVPDDPNTFPGIYGSPEEGRWYPDRRPPEKPL